VGEKPDVTWVRNNLEIIKGVFMMPKEKIMSILNKMLSLSTSSSKATELIQNFIKEVESAQVPEISNPDDVGALVGGIFNVNDELWRKAVEFDGEMTDLYGNNAISREAYRCSVALVMDCNIATDAARKVAQLFLVSTDLNI